MPSLTRLDSLGNEWPTRDRHRYSCWISRCILSIALLMAMGPLSARIAFAEVIWFSPWSKATDFMALFSPNAPWKRAASAVSGFEIGDPLAFQGRAADLAQIFSSLRDRGMDLVVGTLALSGRGPGRCGYGVEGYAAPGRAYALARRIQALGGAPRYFVMDEPLYYGHAFDRERAKAGCHFSIADVAKNVAKNIAGLRTVFPNVRVGDVEPLMAFSEATWLTDLENWLDAFQSETGDALAFFRLDLAWDSPWQQRISALTQLLQRKGVPLQVIYNGSGKARTDEAWIAEAVTNFEHYEADGGSSPDVSVFQFWTPYPSRTLPESDPRAATWLINQYIDWRHSHHHIRTN